MSHIYTVKIHGVSHINENGTSRQVLLSNLRKGEKLKLVPDPMNQNDRWAVKVLNSKSQQLGFLPSDARDASALLNGEPVSARVKNLIGGTSWFARTIQGKKYLGLLIVLEKGEVDWQRNSKLKGIAAPIDKLVIKGLKAEKVGNVEHAIILYRQAVSEIEALTKFDRFASAHRMKEAPINRLSLLLEKQKKYSESLEVVNNYFNNFDPVQPNKSDRESISKRKARLEKRIG